MNIRSWEIWHTYSTAISSKALNFHEIIKNLVASQAFEFIYSDDGYCVWRNGDGYEDGQTHLIPQDNNEGYDASLYSAKGNESEIPDFALECFLQSANFTVSNEKLLSQERKIPAKYMRIYLGQCCASHDSGKDVIFYPVIVVYETGIITVELRTISSGTETTVNNFIRGGVNLSSFTLCNFQVNYGMSKAIDDWARKYHSKSVKHRVHELLKAFLSRRDPPKREKNISSNGFNFTLGKVESLDRQSLNDLALSLAGTIKYFSVKRSSVVKYLLFGLPDEIYKKRYWCSRPYIFLYEFENQEHFASENSLVYASIFQKILNRVSDKDSEKLTLQTIPEDLRAFDDYNFYITKSAALCVWSKEGKRQVYPKDSNNGHLTYEQQSIAEVLEYGHVVHQRLLEDIGDIQKLDAVLSMKKELLTLRANLRTVGKYGEINNIFEKGWSELKVDRLSSDAEMLLDVQSELFNYRQRVYLSHLSLSVAIAVGVLSAPTFTREVTRPLWNFISPEFCLSSAFESILLHGITFSVLGGVIWGLYRVLRIKA